jgi:oligoendopeptidase F
MTKSSIDTSKTSWDLNPLLDGEDSPQIQQYRDSITKSTEVFTKKWRPRIGELHELATLKEALDDLEAWEEQTGLGNEGFYFGLRLTTDTANAKLQAKNNQADEWIQNLTNQMQFFWLSIGKIDPKYHADLLAAPELKTYHHYLEKQFAGAKHRLSEAEEQILNLKRSVSHDKWEEMTERFLSQGERQVTNEAGKTVTANLETLLSLVSSTDKKTRDGAAQQLNDLLLSYLDMAESEMNALLANKKIDDELRGFERPDSARHLADDIDTSVVDALIEAVAGRNDIPQRFYALKAQLLGQKQLAYHERNVPYGTVSKVYEYPEAVDLVHDTFNQVRPEFGDIFKRFVEGGQVDVFPKKGKRGGAFCTIRSRKHPVYVMLNHTNKLTDVSTIAHEFGHAINHELAKEQKELNYGVTMATAEVASTFMEGFVLDRLLEEADDELRLALLIDQVNGTVSSIFRQIAMYRFEQELHAEFRKAGFIPREQIGAIYRKYMETYMGEAVSQDEGSENWWLYVGHFRIMFYVYSYASGELISKALASKVKQDPTFINQVRDGFLTVGTSKSMKDMFGDIGIDITDKTFWEQGLAEIDDLLTQTEKLAKKLGKI